MQRPKAPPSQETITIAEGVLSETLGGKILLNEGEDLQGGVYGRMRFPSCWYVYQLPDHIPLRMESTYRAELIKGCPEAGNDTLFYHAIAEACVYWMIDWYQMVPLPKILSKDRPVAAATDRQRYLMRSEIVARTTEETGHMEAVGATIRAMAKKMRILWPDLEEAPYYPAFR